MIRRKLLARELVSKGVIELATPGMVRGWAINSKSLNLPATVNVFNNGKYAGSIVANDHRKALKSRGAHPTGDCGFRLTGHHAEELISPGVLEFQIDGVKKKLRGSPKYIGLSLTDYLAMSETPPIVFMHIPKTGGTSFRVALEKVMGRSRVAYDYGKKEIATSPAIRASIYSPGAEPYVVDALYQVGAKVLCGHFGYERYMRCLPASIAPWCTFVREPSERILSEYLHHERASSGRNAARLNLDAFRQYFNRPSERNKQSRLMGDLELTSLAFLGLTERYDDSVEIFENRFDLSVPKLTMNRSAADYTVYESLTKSLRSEITGLNDRDYDLYESALTHFEKQ